MDAKALVLALMLLSSAFIADAQIGGGVRRRYPGGTRRRPNGYGCGGFICPRGSRCVPVRCIRSPCPHIRNCVRF